MLPIASCSISQPSKWMFLSITDLSTIKRFSRISTTELIYSSAPPSKKSSVSLATSRHIAPPEHRFAKSWERPNTLSIPSMVRIHSSTTTCHCLPASAMPYGTFSSFQSMPRTLCHSLGGLTNMLCFIGPLCKKATLRLQPNSSRVPF